jgi:hypothetical protein
MSENNTERAPQIRRVEAEEVRKSLDSFEVAPPIPVEWQRVILHGSSIESIAVQYRRQAQP